MFDFCFIVEAAGFVDGFFWFVVDKEATLYNDKSCEKGLIFNL